MDLESVRRRNRVRIGGLALLAGLNLTALGVLVAAAPMVWFGVELRWVLRIALPVSVLVVVAYCTWRVRRSARETVDGLGGRVLDPGEWPRTQAVVEELALAMGTPPVRVAAVVDPVPNALTVGAGPDRTVIVVTTGLVAHLSRDELQAVLAAQVAAIARLDVALRTVVVSASSAAVSFRRELRELVDVGVYGRILQALTWPTKIAAQLVRRAALHSADFGADEMAVHITRHPAALRSALLKLLRHPGTAAAVTPDNAPLWFEPVPHQDADRDLTWARLAMTPRLEDRIARLPGAEGRLIPPRPAPPDRRDRPLRSSHVGGGAGSSG